MKKKDIVKRVFSVVLAVVLSMSLAVSAAPFAGAIESTIVPAAVVPKTIDLTPFVGIEDIVVPYDSHWVILHETFNNAGVPYERVRILFVSDFDGLVFEHSLTSIPPYNFLAFFNGSSNWGIRATGIQWVKPISSSNWIESSASWMINWFQVDWYICNRFVRGYNANSNAWDENYFLKESVATLLLPNIDEPYHLNHFPSAFYGSGEPAEDDFDISRFGNGIANAWSDEIVPYSILMQHEHRRDWFTLVLSALPIEVQAVPAMHDPPFDDIISSIDWMKPIVFTNNALDSSVYKASIFEIFYDENTGEVYLSDTSYGIPADVSDISRFWTSYDIPLAFFDGASYAYSGAPFYIASSGRIYDSTPPDPDDPDPPTDPDPDDGFWPWWKYQWLSFREWLDNVFSFGNPSDCVHEYVYEDIIAATCTQTGSRLYTCKNCGDIYTEEIPVLGHDWILIERVVIDASEESDPQTTVEDDVNPPDESEKSYDLYRCSICGEEYKDYGDSDSTLIGMIRRLFEAVGGFLEKLLDWLLSLGTSAVAGITSFVDDIPTLFVTEGENGFLSFLGEAVSVIPPEIITAITILIIAAVAALIIRKVFLR